MRCRHGEAHGRRGFLNIRWPVVGGRPSSSIVNRLGNYLSRDVNPCSESCLVCVGGWNEMVLLIINLVDLDKEPLQSLSHRSDKRKRRS